MSEARTLPVSLRRGAAAALALIALAPAALAAQRSPSDEELARRLEELTPRYLAADAAADSAERASELARAAAIEQDTVQVGPLRIVTSRDQVELARRIWTDEWARYDAITRGRTDPLAGVTFVFHRGRNREYWIEGPVREVQFDDAFPASEAVMRRGVRNAIGSQVVELLPYELQPALQGIGALGVEPTGETVYRGLATAPTELARACFGGFVVACWTALGQMDPSADVVETWFTADERRSLVWLLPPDRSANIALRNRCLGGEAQACAMVAYARLDESQPLPAAARASLIWFALERGGAGSLDRLWRSVDPEGRPTDERAREADERLTARVMRGRAPDPSAGFMLDAGTDVRTHLAAAANVDGDQLIREWLATVQAAAPPPAVPERRAGASSLLWITLLAALAARSTRWRLG